jgi:hypothetical protein
MLPRAAFETVEDDFNAQLPGAFLRIMRHHARRGDLDHGHLLAEQERINISDRTKAGLQRARKAGRVLGRAPMQIDMKRFRQMRAKGQSLRDVAEVLGCSASLLVKRERLDRP